MFFHKAIWDERNGVVRYPTLLNDEYHANQTHISRSVVGTIRRGGTYTAKYRMENPSVTTAALEFGSAFHCAMDPNGDFEHTYRRCAPGAQNTKAYKEAQAILDEAYPDSIWLKPADWQALKDMKERVHSNRAVKELIDGELLCEQSFFWKDEMTGVPIKCRPDLINVTKKLIVDWKTTTDASKRGFEKSVMAYQYYLQPPWYKAGVQKYFGSKKDWKFVFVCIEKVPPYNVAVWTLPPHVELYGCWEMQYGLLEWQMAQETGIYQAYPEVIQEMETPNWIAEIVAEESRKWEDINSKGTQPNPEGSSTENTTSANRDSGT